jgi:hypothetical protein
LQFFSGTILPAPDATVDIATYRGLASLPTAPGSRFGHIPIEDDATPVRPSALSEAIHRSAVGVRSADCLEADAPRVHFSSDTAARSWEELPVSLVKVLQRQDVQSLVRHQVHPPDRPNHALIGHRDKAFGDGQQLIAASVD